MIDWQFLMQKKDCWFWQTVDRSELTIEAGIYRIIGKGNCLQNCHVEINCSYQSFEEENRFNKYLFKRFRCLNSAGLIMVIPFTYFSPGWWQFSCQSDVFSEIFGQFWRRILQLQVLPQQNSDRESEKYILKIKNVIKNSKKRAFFKLDRIASGFARSDLFNFVPNNIDRQKLNYVLETAAILSKKQDFTLLKQEALPILAGITLNLIALDRYKKLLEIFKESTNNKSGNLPRTKLEILPFQLNLLETPKMTQIDTNFRASLGQVLPPKIARSSLDRRQKKYPQLPRIAASVPIPTINIDKPTSFKLAKENKNTYQKKSLYSQLKINKNIEKVDKDFKALKLKERFWLRLNSLASLIDEED